MKQLTVISPIFLPLSFITGFFVMNFSFLINHLGHASWTFFVLGIGSMVLSGIALLVYFHREAWV